MYFRGVRTAVFLALLLVAPPASAQFKATKQPDVRYVPSPDSVVDAMLELAHVTAADVVYDLGSGDGRIPIAAANALSDVYAMGGRPISALSIAGPRTTRRQPASSIASGS